MKRVIRNFLIIFTAVFCLCSNSLAADYYARVILVGDTGSGKTSLWKRIFQDGFSIDEQRSDMMIRRDIIKTIGNKEIQFNIWDTAGAESYYNEVVDFTQGANFVIIVHDTSIKYDSSRENYLTNLYANIHRKIKSDGKILLVGNKWDLRHDNIVNASKHESLLENVAKSIPCTLKLVSSKDNSGNINTGKNNVLDILCNACAKMELYTSNPDSSFQKRFQVKKGGWCALL